jgi:hypothetical protein
MAGAMEERLIWSAVHQIETRIWSLQQMETRGKEDISCGHVLLEGKLSRSQVNWGKNLIAK